MLKSGKMFKVSVCIPVYNVANYIETCAKSLMEQTLDEIEYIFVDDCSPDNSIELLKKTLSHYPLRLQSVKIIRNDENKGPALSRKRAAESATGKFVYFPDSDDWIEPDMLEIMYNKGIEENADIVKCTYVNEYSNRSVISKELFKFGNEEWRKRILTSDGVYIGLTTSLIRNDLNKIVLKDFPEKRLYCFEDYLHMVKLHFTAEITSWVDKAFYHRNTINPYSVSKISKHQIESKLYVAQAIDDFFARRSDKKQYQNDILRFIANAKLVLLSSNNAWNPNRWKKLWPETNNPELIIPYGLSTRLYKKVAMNVYAGHNYTAYLMMLSSNIILSAARKIRSLLR